MKDENVILILYISICIFISCAAVAHKFLVQNKDEIERAPAVYYVKRVDTRPEFDKYNIY